MAIVETAFKDNLIIEAAGDLVNTVVQSICDSTVLDSSGYTYNADWLERFESIKNLNIISAHTGRDFKKATHEKPNRYPYAGFFLDNVVRDYESGDESFQGSLGLQIGVEQPTFALAQKELIDIHSVCRTLLHLDKSLGEIARGVLGIEDSLPGTAIFKGLDVAGTDTFFTDLSPGEWIALEKDIDSFGVIDSITNDTKLRLMDAYTGEEGMTGEIATVRYIKRGGLLSRLEWTNFIVPILPLNQKRMGDAFMDLISYFTVYYTDDVYRCCGIGERHDS